MVQNMFFGGLNLCGDKKFTIVITGENLTQDKLMGALKRGLWEFERKEVLIYASK